MGQDTYETDVLQGWRFFPGEGRITVFIASKEAFGWDKEDGDGVQDGW